MRDVDVLIIGAGPAGIAAAVAAKRAGAKSVVALDRENRPGGILNQCIHEGFGIVKYHKLLTGTEYACRERGIAEAEDIEFLNNTSATSITSNCVVHAFGPEGALSLNFKSLILATGCRERTRGSIMIPGSRPAGVFTAGVAQNLVNVQNIMPGKRIAIVGSGDIGLIMARRFALEGAEVVAVVEMRPEPSGLQRNVAQCIQDFDTPLLVNHTVTRIDGDKRVTGVEIAKVDGTGKPVSGTEQYLDCDTIVLSVGLIPENELAKSIGVDIDPTTGGVVTDPYLQTNIAGIFSCGNSRAISDLVDYVSAEGEAAGYNAAAYAHGGNLIPFDEHEKLQLPKGFPAKDAITCILCPKGCRIRLTSSADAIGYSCQRGQAYAMQELVEPKRTLATTIKTASGALLPVKSAEQLPKEELIRACDHISKTPPIQQSLTCGEMIQDAACFEGTRIIATDDYYC